VLGYSRDSKYYGEFLNCIPKFSKLQFLELSLSGAGDDCIWSFLEPTAQNWGTKLFHLELLIFLKINFTVKKTICRIQRCVRWWNSGVVRRWKLQIHMCTSTGGIKSNNWRDSIGTFKFTWVTGIVSHIHSRMSAEIAQTALDEKRLNMPKYSLSSLYIHPWKHHL
jgi:hypothetical protein